MDQDELPAYGAAPSTSRPTGPPLKAQSKGVVLTAPGGPYSYGDLVPVSLSVDASTLASAADAATVSFEGVSECTIMGKERWQMAQMANAGFGGGSGQLITSQDQYTFFSQTLDLSLHGKGEVPGVRMTRGDGGVVTLDINTLKVPEEGSGQEPHPPTLQAGMAPTGVPIVQSRWRVKVVIKKPGIFSRNIKVSVDVPVAAPSKPMLNRAKEGSMPLMMTAGASTEHPTLTATFRLTPSQSQTSGLFPFEVFLRTWPTPSLLSAIDQREGEGPRIEVSVSRHLFTKPLTNTGAGNKDGFWWAGERISTVRNWSRTHPGPVDMERKAFEDGVLWAGRIGVPAGSTTASSAAFHVEFRIRAEVTWPARLEKPISLTIPLLLPSSGTVA